MVKISGDSVRERVCKFLTRYRCTPHSTTGLSPAELMFGRNIRTHIDLLHPNLHEHVTRKQTAQKIQHDKHAVDRDISVGDDVFVRNFSLHGGKWLPGLVVECTGSLSYKVKTATHGIVRRHQDQIQTSVHHYTEDQISDSLVNEDLTLPQGHRPRSLSVDSDPKDDSVQEQE